MDQAGLRAWEVKCIQNEPPWCQAGCPLDIDCRGFLAYMAAGNLRKARAILEKKMVLPDVTARMCEAPCETFCLRENFGGSLSVGLLERYCVEHETSRSKVLRLPARPRSVLIVGGGPSSLTVANDLARKGYSTTLLHTGNQPGSWLNDVDEKRLPKKTVQEEVRQLKALQVTFRHVETLDDGCILATQADAVYIGQDDVIAPDVLELIGRVDPRTYAAEKRGWFAGGFSGEDHRYRFINDLSQGRQAALSIDRCLQRVSLTAERPWVRGGRTNLYTNTAGVSDLSRIIPENKANFSREEARAEAARCLQCQCMECVKNCVFLQDFGAFPKVYVRQIYNNSAIVKGVHQANKLINSCSLCGQCAELCPNDFSMADLCLDARRLMVRENRMPRSAHWFGLEEMRSAGTEGAFVRHAPGCIASRVLFFPGCQLSGTRPDQTMRLYEYLRQKQPETGIWLDCCSAPALWAGQEEERERWCDRLKELWRDMGEVPVVTGCSSCLKMFRDYFPEVPVRSVWSLIAEQPLRVQAGGGVLAISDPCTARNDATTRNDVRKLLQETGHQLAPLKMSGELTECCGFGGLMENANPELAKRTAQRRVDQTDHVILTYCAMCREQLAKGGGQVIHLLDLIFPDIARDPSAPAVSLSDRRKNRRTLKNELIDSYPGLPSITVEEWADIELEFTDTARALLEERRILEDDIRRVLFTVSNGEGSRFRHDVREMNLASARFGPVTFWIMYRHKGDGYLVERCWSHRMEITGVGT